MPTPMPLPMRVLVKGPSTVLLTSMMGGPRTDLAFPRAIEKQLLAGGRPAVVRNGGELGWPTGDLFKHWDEEVLAWSPDVIILAVGHYEILHTILPRWLERGANAVNRRPGLIRHLYYRRFLRLIARGVLLTQKRTDRPGRNLNKRRRRKALRDTAGFINMTSNVGHPLILLMEIHVSTAEKRVWFPGWAERTHALNQDLRELAAANADQNVRFVEISDLMDQFEPGDPEHLWADGIHFSPPFHQAIAVKFAGIAEEWASSQPHLATP